MAKKAISPIIAVVILIALVVTLGGLLSTWLSKFVYDASQQDTCALYTRYTISEALYNSSSGQIKVKVKNSGKPDLYNFSIEADNRTLMSVIPAYSPDQTYHLASGQSQYVLASSLEYNITNIDTIKLLVRSCTSYSPSPVKVQRIAS